MDLCVIAMIFLFIHTICEAKWRIIRDRMKIGRNCLVFIRHWVKLPDSVDIRSPVHLIGQKPSNRESVPKLNCIEQGTKVVGIRNRRQEGKIDCAFAETRQNQSLANAKKSQSCTGVSVSVHLSTVQLMEENGMSVNGVVIIALRIVGEVLH